MCVFCVRVAVSYKAWDFGCVVKTLFFFSHVTANKKLSYGRVRVAGLRRGTTTTSFLIHPRTAPLTEKASLLNVSLLISEGDYIRAVPHRAPLP